MCHHAQVTIIRAANRAQRYLASRSPTAPRLPIETLEIS